MQSPSISIYALRSILASPHTLTQTHLVTPSASYPLTALTNFFSTSQKSFYSISSIIYFSTNKNAFSSHSAYVSSAQKLNCGFIRSEDKPLLDAFLHPSPSSAHTDITSNINFFTKKSGPEITNTHLPEIELNLNNFKHFENNQLASYRPKKPRPSLAPALSSAISALGTLPVKTAPSHPILIVPNNIFCPINFNNCINSLFSYKIEKSDVSTLSNMANLSSAQKPDMIIKKKNRSGKLKGVSFRVKESMKNLKFKERERVVAVFCSGEDYLREEWELEEDFFRRVLGVSCVWGEKEMAETEEMGIKVFRFGEDDRENARRVGQIWAEVWKAVGRVGARKLLV